MSQVGIPVQVNPNEVARKATLGQALDLCMELAGLEPKQLMAGIKLDKAQLSRWQSGQEGVSWPKLVAVMDYCGNDAPLLWMCHSRGIDLNSIRKVESEVERQNRLLREENAALKRVLLGGAAA